METYLRWGRFSPKVLLLALRATVGFFKEGAETLWSEGNPFRGGRGFYSRREVDRYAPQRSNPCSSQRSKGGGWTLCSSQRSKGGNPPLLRWEGRFTPAEQPKVAALREREGDLRGGGATPAQQGFLLAPLKTLGEQTRVGNLPTKVSRSAREERVTFSSSRRGRFSPLVRQQPSVDVAIPAPFFLKDKGSLLALRATFQRSKGSFSLRTSPPEVAPLARSAIPPLSFPPKEAASHPCPPKV